jgi:hypothetical protein
VIVALMPSFGRRAEHQDFVTAHYRVVWGIPTILGGDERDASGRFSRARAINNAARAAVREHPSVTRFVIADNDIIPDEPAFEAALGTDAACLPHSDALDLTPEATRRYKLDGTIGEHTPRAWPTLATAVLTREAFHAVNGMDELFTGWGGEDNALYHALTKLVGPVPRGEGKCVHLWHPIDASKRDQANRRRNTVRAAAYRDADPTETRLLSREYGELRL